MSSVEKPRLTLKLRTPVSPTRSAAKPAVPAAPAPQAATFEPPNKRPRADWSEVHKSAMQADMDRLARGGKSE